MKIKDVKDWMNGFDENEEFHITVGDTEKRVVHKAKQIFFLTDLPCIMFETVESEPMDEEGQA